jgi:hypothetical protein
MRTLVSALVVVFLQACGGGGDASGEKPADQCVTGKPCGKACIAKENTCHL